MFLSMDVNEVYVLFMEDNNLQIDFQNRNYLIQELAQPVFVENFEVEPRNRLNRNENYFEVTIPRYTNDQFHEHFRMSRGTFETLVHVIGHRIGEDPVMPVPLVKSILFSIWLLATPESFRASGDRFGLSKSTGHAVFKQIVRILVQLMPQYIMWPNIETCASNATVFEEQSQGFPGIVGAIDGCHIPCRQPPRNPNDYYNRKGSHSIILQAVCDQRAKFIDCFIGLPGRMHDAAVFRNSPLFQRLNGGNNILPPNLHLVGDSAYPLMHNVMTPFRDTGHLTRRQILYNTKLSVCRSIVERSFGLLKGKFRRLKYLDIQDLGLGNNIIGSACVLHNFILENENNNEGLDANIAYIGDEVDANVDVLDLPAIHKRNEIVANL